MIVTAIPLNIRALVLVGELQQFAVEQLMESYLICEWLCGKIVDRLKIRIGRTVIIIAITLDTAKVRDAKIVSPIISPFERTFFFLYNA